MTSQECPYCKIPLTGIMPHADNDYAQLRIYCRKCGGFIRGDYLEHPEVIRGRQMCDEFKNVHVLDRRMTRLPGRVQLGILRELHKREAENDNS